MSARVQDARGATSDGVPALALLSPEALAEHVRLFGRTYRAAPCKCGDCLSCEARWIGAREPWLPLVRGALDRRS